MSTSNTDTTPNLSDEEALALQQNHDVQTRSNPLPVVKDGDAREGFFVNIDQDAKGVKKAYKDAGLEGDAGVGAGSYGVWYSTTRDGDAIVRLRDSTNAFLTVPVAALSAADAGGR